MFGSQLLSFAGTQRVSDPGCIDIGLTFAAALRSFRRQDSDVMPVGEIRNPETAAVAMQAAMTGHFVLASIHANDAFAVVPRLLDIGVEPYQLAAGLRGVGAQRLVRRLCSHCRQPSPLPDEDAIILRSFGVEAPGELVRPTGWERCGGPGYRGRVAIGEALVTDTGMLRAIAEAEPMDALMQRGRAGGFLPMAVDGARKVVDGTTTLDEVLAAVHA